MQQIDSSGAESDEMFDDGVDMGPRPEGLTHLSDAMWESLPTPTRKALRDQLAAQKANVHDIVARYKEQIAGLQQAGQRQPAKEADSDEIPVDRLTELGGKVFDKFFGAATSGLDDDQREQFKSVNGQVMIDVIRRIAQAEARAAAGGVKGEMSQKAARDQVFAEIERSLPGALSQPESPAGMRLRDRINQRAAAIAATSGEEAAQRYLDDPHWLHSIAETVSAEMAAESGRKRVVPALGTGEDRPRQPSRARALQRDGRTKDAFEAALADFVGG